MGEHIRVRGGGCRKDCDPALPPTPLYTLSPERLPTLRMSLADSGLALPRQKQTLRDTLQAPKAQSSEAVVEGLMKDTGLGSWGNWGNTESRSAERGELLASHSPLHWQKGQTRPLQGLKGNFVLDRLPTLPWPCFG